MKRPVSWTDHYEDGTTRDVRVEVAASSIKWQFKPEGETTWDRDSEPDMEDWEMLEDILARRAARGKAVNLQKIVRKWRILQGHPGVSELDQD